MTEKMSFCRLFVEIQKYPFVNSLCYKELDKQGLFKSSIAQLLPKIKVYYNNLGG